MCIWIIYTTTASYAGLHIRKIDFFVVWLGCMERCAKGNYSAGSEDQGTIGRSERRSKSGGDEGWRNMTRCACM